MRIGSMNHAQQIQYDGLALDASLVRSSSESTRATSRGITGGFDTVPSMVSNLNNSANLSKPSGHFSNA